MTSLAADTFGMVDRGRIREGAWADLVLFDPVAITDTATYDEPKQYPAGIRAVWVNGALSVDDGEDRRAGAGKMLRFRRDEFPG
jgi:N-acyl-D-amino-acid deacylase